MKKNLLFIILSFFLFSCTRTSDEISIGRTTTYRPVYLTADRASEIKMEAAKPITSPGKIYAFGNFIYENDINTGIHIINIADRSKPVKVAFINIPLCTEVAVKGNHLYTNNLSDLITFDITDPVNPVLVKRIKNAFRMPNQKYPPFNNVAFECPDESKGVVVKWEEAEVKNPKCRR